ncbi:response regulator [Aquicoccus sp. SCR17]|nr:response regulator [Carideicomes alvinocaridis]
MGRHIVAIDDSEIAREMVKATLADFGFDRVTTYPGPMEALSAFQSGEPPPDLILLDIMMPEMDGIELCARLRMLAGWTDVPIVMLTSRSDKQALSRAFMAGANDYVSKPFDRVELQARITSLLRLRSEMDRRRAAVAEWRPAARGAETADTAPPAGTLLGKAGLLRALEALTPAALPELGLMALRLDCLASDHADFTPAERRACIEVFGRTLGRWPMPAGDLLALWEDDIFLVASTVQDGASLARQAQEIVSDLPDSLKAARIWHTHEPSVSAGLALPGSFPSLSAGLGNVLQALDTAVHQGGGRLGGADMPDQQKRTH